MEYHKLVRDNIPDIIKNNGEIPIIRILDDEEYYKCLLLKDSEELKEVKNAKTKEEVKEELADKLEVLSHIAYYHGFTLEEIMTEANKKKAKRGGFSKKIFLEDVIKKEK